MGEVWRKNSLYSFWQGFNEKIQLWLLRFLWCGFSICLFFCFIGSLLCFTFHFIIISNWVLLSEKGRIQFTALPWEGIPVLCFLLFDKDSTISLVNLSAVFSLHIISKLNAKFIACLASWDNLCLGFNLSAHAVLDPTLPRKPSHWSKYPFLSIY